MKTACIVASATVLFSAVGLVHAVPVLTFAAGQDAASILGPVDAFRISLGALNPNTAGSFGNGRREINWDGVPNALSAPNLLPGNFFNANSPRGAVLSTPGIGFQVSASSGSGTPVEFGNLDARYPSLFTTFSPQRLFSALGSNIVDINFFIPGSMVAATVGGFGAVFSDVDLADTSSLTFFDQDNASLGTFFVPAFGGSETLSFLGVTFTSERIGRVRITAGSQPLGGVEVNGADLVVLDDFIYGEPVLAAVPEPETFALLFAGLGFVGLATRRAKRRQGAAQGSMA